MTDLVVIGAGGHGREIVDTVLTPPHSGHDPRRMVWMLRGVVDDDPPHPDRLARLGVTMLGDVSWLVDHPTAYVIGVGTPHVRRRIADRLAALPARAATVVHPGAHVGLDVELGDGVVVFDRCTITTNVAIGAHTHLNVGCAVQHDSVLGDYVQMSPGVLVNGDCRVDDGAFLGTGAIVTRGCKVGSGARVGAGAVVLGDVEPGATVVGAPARPR